MKTYESYINSGIDWLGDIPEHWECKRLGTWFRERRQKVSDKDYEPLSVTKNGIVPQLENAAKSNDGDNRKLVLKGDFVINSRSDRKGSSGLSKLDGSVSLINIVMEPKGIYGDFSNYLLKSNSFIEEFYRNGHGIVADLWTTRYDEMKFIHLAIPPIHEQEAIATFLDEKCGKIDALVEIKSQQIEKLKELRQVKIHQAVTKGLNPNAEMRNSGIDWIGEIPNHWEVKRLKAITDFVNRGSAPDYIEHSNYRVINQATFSKGYIDLSNIKYTNISIKEYNLNRGLVKYNDLLIASTGGGVLGKVAIFDLEEGRYVADSHVTIVRCNNYIALNRFIYYFFSINYDLINGVLAQGSTNQTELQRNWLLNFNLSIPPLPEQEAIVAYLEEVTGKIDQAIAQKQKQIEKLKEYKQSLINDVVTGKVKVC